ncbi:MAG: ABC transporter substrate-binding protein [Eggerthellaceae bacterium]|jgi:NitT/TauT family transport system substrate-binding protein
MQSRLPKAGKVILLFASVFALMLALVGCSSGQEQKASTENPTEVRVVSLKGPTSIGLASMMNQTDTVDTYTYDIQGTPDAATSGFLKGDYDIALVPANLASVLYNKTDKNVTCLDINTLGVLYVVSGDDSIASLQDLEGKTVYMTGKGATPEYAMKYLLSQNGLQDKVTLEYKSEATEVASILEDDPTAIAVLPEPYVTTVNMKNSEIETRISLSDEWDKCSSDGSKMVTGVTIVSNDFLKEHPEAVERFIESQSKSVSDVTSDPSSYAQAVVDAGIIGNVEAAEKAIPQCNIVCLTNDDLKTSLSGYLKVLNDFDPASIGGALPDDDFYYES